MHRSLGHQGQRREGFRFHGILPARHGQPSWNGSRESSRLVFPFDSTRRRPRSLTLTSFPLPHFAIPPGPRLPLQRHLQMVHPHCRTQRGLPEGPYLVQGDARRGLGGQLPYLPCRSAGTSEVEVPALIRSFSLSSLLRLVVPSDASLSIYNPPRVFLPCSLFPSLFGFLPSL